MANSPLEEDAFNSTVDFIYQKNPSEPWKPHVTFK